MTRVKNIPMQKQQWQLEYSNVMSQHAHSSVSWIPIFSLIYRALLSWLASTIFLCSFDRTETWILFGIQRYSRMNFDDEHTYEYKTIGNVYGTPCKLIIEVYFRGSGFYGNHQQCIWKSFARRFHDEYHTSSSLLNKSCWCSKACGWIWKFILDYVIEWTIRVRNIHITYI